MSFETAGDRPSRIARERLDALDFPIKVEVPIRFADLDTLGHVNNAAAAVILQEGRVLFNQRTTLPDLEAGLRLVVAGLRIEFAMELRYPGVVEVCTAITTIGRSSFSMVQVGRQNGRSALYAEITIVVCNASGAVPISDGLRAEMERVRTGVR
jgi:acyl-CoA thioester hydrolase